jgi:hypothetical protein
MMNKTFLTVAVIGLALTISAASVAEAREGRVRARGDHGVGVAAAGPNGGAVVRGRGAVENPDGSVTAGRAGAVRTPEGGRAARASKTTVNPDGTAQRESGVVGQSAAGGVAQTSGETTRNADGTISSDRTTQAKAADGSTFSATTSYDAATGITRSTTCTNAAGAVVACPR